MRFLHKPTLNNISNLIIMWLAIKKWGLNMSSYLINKAIRDINQNPDKREAFFADRRAFVEKYDLTSEERDAIAEVDVTALYRLKVHGLILRPFTLLHKMPENEYLEAIRAN